MHQKKQPPQKKNPVDSCRFPSHGGFPVGKKKTKKLGLSKLKNRKDHWSRHHSPISGILWATDVSSDSTSLVRLPRPFGLRRIHHSPLQCCNGSRSSRSSCAYGLPPLHLSLGLPYGSFHGGTPIAGWFIHVYTGKSYENRWLLGGTGVPLF